MREHLHARLIVWNNSVLNQIDTRVILPRCESSCMVYIVEVLIPDQGPHQRFIGYRYFNHVGIEFQSGRNR